MALNQSGLLFVPKAWQRATFVNWLKKIHAWTGFWGALLFLMMGTSGFLLNHRDKLKIDVDQPVEVDATEIAVAPGLIDSPKALGRWAKATLHLKGEPRPPRKPGGAGGREGGRERFMGQDVAAATKWSVAFTTPSQKVTLDYVPGDSHVSAKREASGFLATIKNMHKGVGLPVAWVLFIDTIAGALITMSLTGFLLWSRLHGPRLLAGGLLLACFATFAAICSTVY